MPGPQHMTARFALLAISLAILLAMVSCGDSVDRSESVAQPPAANTNPLILVTGITGHQGGAVARHLLDAGFPVRGISRDPESDAAKAMQTLGAVIVPGDFADTESLLAAMNGAGGVFLNTPDTPNQLQLGRNVTDAAIASGIRHLVYSCYLSCDPDYGNSGAPKSRVQKYIMESGIPYTILRPVFFMRNHSPRMKITIEQTGVLQDPRAPDSLHQFVAIEDIGYVATEVFANRDEFLNAGINLASDELTYAEEAALLGTILGREVVFQQISWEEDPRPAFVQVAFRFYEETGLRADVGAVRERFPELYTLERYLQENWL